MYKVNNKCVHLMVYIGNYVNRQGKLKGVQYRYKVRQGAKQTSQTETEA